MKAATYLGSVAFALLLFTTACDGADAMAVGGTLNGVQTLTSVNGTFRLGFFNINNTGNWYLCIWYAQFSVGTIVWVTNRENPLKNNSGSLKLTEEGSLVLSYHNSVIWSTNTTGKASSAVITEAGNLIVYGADDKSEIKWQSFDNPGNTLLPGMKMSASQKLTAWKSPWDPSPGQYSFQIDPDGLNQIVLMWRSSKTYWESGVWNGHTFSRYTEFTQNSYGYSFVDNGSYRYDTYSVKKSNLLSHIRLSEDGTWKQMYSVENNVWNLLWVVPRDQCQVYELCGSNAYCGEDNGQFCNCLEGFTPADTLTWQAQVWSGGCARRIALDCPNGTTDGFIEVAEKGIPSGAVESPAKNCREECLRNCSCTAYVVIGDGTCWRWFGELLNFATTVATANLFVRVAAASMPKKNLSKKTPAASGAAAAAALAVIVAVSVLLCLFCHRRRKPRQSSDYVPASLTVFSYRELQVATNSFNERLGGGGFGSVFKGTLPDKSVVAVKKLEGFSQGEKQFRAEVSTIGIIHHVNLIRLRGFCSEGSHRLLVYDYMPNGSLNAFLFPKRTPGKESTTLDWKTRFNIALGTARGILYLHENCRESIIHFDIKPGNILLDADFCPKVADFGLAKMVGREFSRVLTTMRGTRGYLAPEWLFGLPITRKADVYSFGITLLEIIAGRRNMETHPESSEILFAAWATIQINSGNIVALLDKKLHSNADAEQVKRAAMVGGWCIQEHEDARPSMKRVLQLLEGNEDVAVPPVPMFLQRLIADPSNVMAYWDKEIEPASLSMTCSP